MNHLERLCRIMGTFDLATGHAETMSDALDALEEELRDVLGHLRSRREWVGLTDKEQRMKPKIRKILEECIDTGIKHGLNMAHKHTDNPTRPLITESIENAIWLEIDEHFEFDFEQDH